MKKIAALGILLLFVCGAVITAQENDRDTFPIKFQAYGQTTWSPFVYRGRGDLFNIVDDGSVDNAEAGVGVASGPGWDNISGAVGFRVYGNNADDTLGFDLRLRAVPSIDGNRIDIRGYDNAAYLWAKPFGGTFQDALKIQFGAYQWDEFRGKIGTIGGWSNTSGGDEDDIFQRVESDVFGALFILKPPAGVPAALSGLTLFGSFGVSGGLNSNVLTRGDVFAAQAQNALKYIFSTPHAGIAYQNEAFGLARFQFIGSNYFWGNGDDWKEHTINNPFYGTQYTSLAWFPRRVTEASQLEFAVNLTAVPNLNLDFGLGISFKVEVVEDDKSAVKPVGPRPYERELRSADVWTVNAPPIARTKGDVWQPPVTVALGLDYSLADLGLDDLGFRFRTRMEFGEQIAFVNNDMGNYIGGFKLQLGLEPYYQLTAIKSAVSLVFGLRVNQNDKLTYTPSGAPVKEDVVSAASFSHNGVIDLGLGAFLTRRLGGGFVRIGVMANLPLGGDRYTWSTDHVDGLTSPVDELYFGKYATEAYKKGFLLIAVPITIELNF